MSINLSKIHKYLGMKFDFSEELWSVLLIIFFLNPNKEI
jgi:hypothetical protein